MCPFRWRYSRFSLKQQRILAHDPVNTFGIDRRHTIKFCLSAKQRPYAPQGKADGIKIIPLSEVATKDDFFNIKKASAADLLDAHRIPFQLMGGKPENVGSLGDIEKVAKVFVRNELIPLQDRIREINGWLGQEVIRFKNYSLDTDNG